MKAAFCVPQREGSDMVNFFEGLAATSAAVAMLMVASIDSTTQWEIQAVIAVACAGLAHLFHRLSGPSPYRSDL